MTGTSFHKEESVGIVVDVVERVACAGIPTVIHDKEACFFVIVLCIKHTIAVCNAEIAVIVLILRKLRCDRNRLEAVSVRLPVIDISIFLSPVICSRRCVTAAPIVVWGKLLPTGLIIIPIDELIFIIEDFFKQIFRIAVELPIVNIIVIGIEIIVISTEERPQLVGIEVIHRIKVIDRGASPHPFIRGIGEITRICSESSKTALPVSRTAYLANLLIEVIGKFRVVFLRFTQVIVLRCVCAERKTAVRGSRREQHRDNTEYKQYHNDRYRQTKKELFDLALIDILHEFPRCL